MFQFRLTEFAFLTIYAHLTFHFIHTFQFRLTEFAFLTKEDSHERNCEVRVSIPSYGICFFNLTSWCDTGWPPTVSIPSYGICFFNLEESPPGVQSGHQFQFRLTEFAFLTRHRHPGGGCHSPVSIPSYGICFFNIGLIEAIISGLVVSIPSYGICFFNIGLIEAIISGLVVSIPSYGICFFNTQPYYIISRGAFIGQVRRVVKTKKNSSRKRIFF